MDDQTIQAVNAHLKSRTNEEKKCLASAWELLPLLLIQTLTYSERAEITQFPLKTKDDAENAFGEFWTKSPVNVVLNKRSHFAFVSSFVFLFFFARLSLYGTTTDLAY